jgi:ABC-type antimicrobial peptide transport system ATPase subunit
MGSYSLMMNFFICKENKVSSCHHAFRLLRRKEVKTNNNHCQTGRESNRIDNMAEKVQTLYCGISLVIATCRVLKIMLLVV